MKNVLFLIYSYVFFIHAAVAGESLSYSGRLVQASGAPVAGPVNLLVELSYTNAPSSILCSQTINSVPLTNGVFHLKLDLDCGVNSLQYILSNVPNGEAASLRVKDLTNNKTYAFQAIHSMPFANVAETAKQVVQMGATDGQVLKWNNTTKKWEPGAAGGVGTVTNVTVTAPLQIVNGSTTPNISIPLANTTTSGYLSSADWNTFNSKEGSLPAGSALQYFRGDKSWQTLNTSAVPENVNLYFTNARVLGVPLLGFAANNAAIVATDDVLTGFNKAQGQINALNTQAANFLVKNGTDSITGVVNVNTIGLLQLGYAPVGLTDAANKAYVDTKLDLSGGTLSGDLALDTQLKLKNGGAANYITVKAPATGSMAYTLSLPLTAGSANQVLTTDGSGITSWTTPSTTATPTGAAGGDLSGTYPNPTISGLAATKISGGTVDNTEFDYLNGVTSSIQTQLNAKEGTITAGTALQYYRGDKTFATLNTSVVPENTNLYFTNARVLGVPLTGFSATNAAIVAADTVLVGLNKAQGQIDNLITSKASVAGDVFTGDMAFNTKIKLRDSGSNYVQLQAPAAVASTYTITLPPNPGTAGQVLTTDGAGVSTWTSIATSAIPTGAAGGDLSGTYPNPTIGAGKVVDSHVSATANIAQSKIANLTTDLAGKLGNTLTNGNIFVGNGSNVATGVAMSGDATITNTGAVTLKNTGTAGTYTSVTTDAQGRVTAGTNPLANSTTTGSLTSTDWNTFNNKQAALSAGATINGIVYPANGTQTLQIPLAPVAANDAVNKAYVDSFGQWTAGGGNVYRTSGNVGIGTSTPSAPLHLVNTVSSTATFKVEGDYNATTPAQFSVVGRTNPNQQLIFGYNTTANYASIQSVFQGTSVEPLILNPGGGNVGVGTITPQTKLDVSGAIRIGADAIACSGTIAGAMRFNTPNVEYCNGTAWTAMAASGAAVASSQITDGTIVNADISATANIDATKLGTGVVDNIEYNYLNGVTSSIQTQINGKQASDATLTALAAYSTNGLLVQTAADTFTGRSITGTANRISVTNGDGVAGNPTLNIDTALLPSPVAGDAGKFLKATAADTSVWTTLSSSDITTALGFTPINKAGDTVATGIFTFNGTAVLRTLDPVGVTDVANKQYVDSYGQWIKSGSDIYRSSGNVGIGTTTPTQKLTIGGIGSNAISQTPRGINLSTTELVGSTGDVGIQLNTPYNSGSILTSNIRNIRGSSSTYVGLEMSTTTAHPIRFLTNSTGENVNERMRIESDGDVGIGTSTPAALFEVLAQTTGDISRFSNVGANARFSIQAPVGGDRINLDVSENSTGNANKNFTFSTGTTERMRITSSGNVGIGTTNPSAPLHVSSTGTTVGRLQAGGTNQWAEIDLINSNTTVDNKYWTISNDGSNGSLKFRTLDDSRANPATMMTFLRDGKIGIGTVSPQSKLDVNGSIRVGADATACSAANAGAMRFTSPNVEYCNGTAWTAFTPSGAAVASSQITDATIVNADISATANIDATKLGTGVVDNTEFNYLNGVTSSIQTQLNGKQTSDATLTALAAFNTNGILVQTAADTFTGRSIAGTANRVSVTNGDGVAGNPTINIPTALLPSPVVGDVGKFLKATAADTSVWTSLSSTDVTTALGFTPVNKAGDSFTTGTFALSGTAALTVQNPVNLLDAANKQYVDSFGQWIKNGSNIYYSAGNVGIGTNAPDRKLHIVKSNNNSAIRLDGFTAGTNMTPVMGAGSDFGALIEGADNGQVVMALRDNDNNDGFRVISGNGNFMTDSVYDMPVFTALSSGNVGIGTAAPLKNLTVEASADPTIRLSEGGSTSSYADIVDFASTQMIIRKVTATGDNMIDISPIPSDGVSRSNVRLFRETNSTGAKRFIIHQGDGSATIDSQVGVGENSWFNLSSGNVGIGTNTPTNKLHVNGSAKIFGNSNFLQPIGTSYDLSLETTNTNRRFLFAGNGNGYSLQSTELSSGLNFSLALNPAGGNVGVGTTTPAQKFSIFGSSVASGAAQTNISAFAGNGINIAGSVSNSSQDALTYQSGGGGGAGIAFRRGTSYDTYMDFYTNNIATPGAITQAMTINNFGNVGIGTSTPVSPLEIAKNGVANGAESSVLSLRTDNAGANAGPTIDFWNGNSTFTSGAGYTASIAGVDDGVFNGRIEFRTNTTGSATRTARLTSADTKMVIKASGSVGIGTTTPGANLHVNSNSPAGYTTIINQNSAAGGQPWVWYSSSTSAPLGANQMCLGLGACLMVLNSSGNMTISGTLAQNSDLRLKRDITLVPDALDSLTQLNGVTYYWKDSDKGTERQLGLIAQEVEKVFPEAVKTNKQGLKSVAYQNLVAPIVESIKEIKQWLLGHDKELKVQKREIASLKDENQMMKKQLEKQQQEIDELKKMMRKK